MFTIISFYTKNWAYPLFAKKLTDRCIKLGINFQIVELPDTGSWLTNTRLKSQYVYESLEQLKTPVLWVDADSTILKKPQIDLSYDCGAVRTPPGHSKTWYVGVLFFNYTDAGREFARLWANSSVDGSDHRAFEETYLQYGNSVKFLEFPNTYTELKRATSDTVISIGLSKDPSKMTYFKKLTTNNENNNNYLDNSKK
jgi:hypothetical protein